MTMCLITGPNKEKLISNCFVRQLGGPPIPVVVNLSIRSMGPVDENRQAFNLDCYFRQSWVDKRLQYNATGKGLGFIHNFKKKMLKSLVSFLNGNFGYENSVKETCFCFKNTTPNDKNFCIFRASSH